MAQILVRRLPDQVKERLAEKARDRGRSLEDEAREALSRAAFSEEREKPLGELLFELFSDVGLAEGEELETPPDGPPPSTIFGE